MTRNPEPGSLFAVPCFAVNLLLLNILPLKSLE